MPEISRFFGIIIRMYFGDHPPPHFHAEYAGTQARVVIESLSVLETNLPPRALGLVMEWAALHQPELFELWALAQANEPLHKIAPLE
ncbi:MAG: DUF4160 domain-containing protein [Verrucomicrobiota bacterium]|nr:DUF4160 domain-containing protein [Chthoniobacterales bacterium]MDQ3413925.1 DUF4160 domain-containing protein [Verrucomicrobiota bacterium]